MLGLLAVAGVATAIAQSSGGREGPGGGRPPMPIIEALDADHDGVISAIEIKNASVALRKLDKNKDGKLTEDEYRPMGRGPGGPGDGDRGGPAGGERRGPEGGDRGGPGGGDRGAGAGPGGPGRGPGEGPGGPGGGQRGPGGQGGGQGGDGGGRGGQGGRPEDRGPDGGGPGGSFSPNPDRMVEHALEFDADKDGKLSKDELQKFVDDFVQRHAGPGGPDGGGRGGAGSPPGGGRPNESGDRSERPRRPD